MPARSAGKPGSACTLLLTEGDSAKALAVAGVSVVGRHDYGIFPLRGKPLNTRKVAPKKLRENAEIGQLVRILGLEFGKVYTSVDSLRYKSLTIFADQDLDGHHIAGLVINLIHSQWPSLLAVCPGFIRRFATPIIKVARGPSASGAGAGKTSPARARGPICAPPRAASRPSPRLPDPYPTPLAQVTRGSSELGFFTAQEFSEWQAANPGGPVRVKYLKGLGSSNNLDAKKYFSHVRAAHGRASLAALAAARRAEGRGVGLQAWAGSAGARAGPAPRCSPGPPSSARSPAARAQLDEHVVVLRHTGAQCDEALITAFDPDRADARKLWLRDSYRPDSFIDYGVSEVPIRTFFDDEFIHFSIHDNARSIPSVLDGLKPTQRKARRAGRRCAPVPRAQSHLAVRLGRRRRRARS